MSATPVHTGLRRTVALLALTLIAAFGITATSGPASAALATAAKAGPAPAARGLDLPPLLPGEQRKIKQTPDGTLVIGHFPAGVAPQSASTCTGVVCMQVVGQSNFVKTWNTQAINPVPTCSWADWLVNLTLVNTTDVLCAGPGVFYANWSPNRTFSSGLACNTWFTLPGTPCIYILK